MENAIQLDTITNNQLIENYLSFSMKQYFCKKFPQETSEYVRLKICELLKYLNLCHCSKGEIFFNGEIDEVWHYWILQTEQYSELMQKLPSGKFIHHCSFDYQKNDAEPTKDEKQEINRQVSFLVSYVHNFGEFTEETRKFWPMVGNLIEMFGINMQGLNLANVLWFKGVKQKPTQILIVRSTKLDKMTVSTSLKKLVVEGLIKRMEHESDTRAKSVQLTAKGKTMASKLVPIVKK